MNDDAHDDDCDYDFDPEKAVVDFREVTQHRDAATTPEAREEFQAVAPRMREAWRKWQGEDSLYEMAFGEWGGEEQPTMCGRFTLRTPMNVLVEHLAVVRRDDGTASPEALRSL